MPRGYRTRPTIGTAFDIGPQLGSKLGLRQVAVGFTEVIEILADVPATPIARARVAVGVVDRLP